MGYDIRSTDFQLTGEFPVLPRLVAAERLFCKIAVVRLHVRPNSQTGRRKPFAFRADVSERRAEVAGMPAGSVHHWAGPVRRHLREQVHCDVRGIFRMGRIQLEIGIRFAIGIVFVLADTLRPDSKRIVLPVPVHIEVLDHRAQTVLNLEVTLADELIRLTLQWGVVATEH